MDPVRTSTTRWSPLSSTTVAPVSRESVRLSQEAVDEIDAERAKWKDPVYVRAQARDRLFYVYPGETAYVVIDDRGPAESVEQAPSFTTDLVEGQGDWVQAGIASIVLAGLTDADADELAAGTPLDAR